MQMGSTKIDVFVVYILAFEVFFCKYWPDDGPWRPKLVASNRIIIKQTYSCVRRNAYFILFY